jgi:hypothetical protein
MCPGPMLQALRRAHSPGPGGAGYSVDKTPNRNRPRRLRIRMTVEFHRWLPLGADNGIRLSRAGLELLL